MHTYLILNFTKIWFVIYMKNRVYNLMQSRMAENLNFWTDFSETPVSNLIKNSAQRFRR